MANTLEIPKGEISCLRLEPASNGVIICYDVKTKKAGAGTYDNYSYDYRKEVFDFDSGEEAFDEAFERFKTLWKAAAKK